MTQVVEGTDNMIDSKGYGQIPANLHEMPVAELRPVLVQLQGQRTDLVDHLVEGREIRDSHTEIVKRAKADAERVALSTLPPARGKDAPAVSAVKSFVDADARVNAAVRAAADHSRLSADIGDRLGSVRSGLRVVDRLLETAVHGDDLPSEDW